MANLNLNKVILGGRVTKDIELKTAGSTQIADFSLAITRRMKKDETDFVNCTAFGKNAEMASKYFHKGSNMCVVGSIRVDAYEKDGQKRTSTKITVDEIHFVDAKSDSGEAPTQSASKQEAPESAPVQAEVADDEELPF